MASRQEKKLSGKVALITGGSRGIGRAIAFAFAREGARLFLCARREDDLAQTAREIREQGGEVQWLAGDIGRLRQAKGIVGAAREHYGVIDVLVNNASVLGPRETIDRYPLSSWERVVRVNLTALFVVTKEAVKIMIEKRRGSIINVSSGVGRVGKARWGGYAASKFGVEGLTQVLADEVRAANIRVNAVNPGGARTAMRAAAYPDEDPLTLPAADQVTGVFLYLASDESLGVTGKSLDAREWMEISN